MNLEKVLSDNIGHVLHLYASNTNKYAVQIPFIATASDVEEVIYVTAEEDLVIEELEVENMKDIDIIIYRPEEMGMLSTHSRGKIVVDASSFGDDSIIEEMEEERRVIGRRILYRKYADCLMREVYLNGLSSKNPLCNILCSYNLDELEPEMNSALMKSHDKIILTPDDTDVCMPSSVLLETANNIAEKYMVRFVKNYLDMIVLAPVLKDKMCGTDIINSIQKSFNVSLSTGTIYPLLHDLEEKGLLDCEYGIRRRYKKKIYKPKDEQKVKDILSEHIQSNNILNKFLRSFPQEFITGMEAKKRKKHERD